MGRPIRYSPNEVRGTLERARHMIEIAPRALADIDVGPKDEFSRFLRREPLGVVFTVAAWNYPYLIAVNSVVPALMAGNAVMLKHSAQTPLVRRTLRTVPARGGTAGRRVSVPALEPRGYRDGDPRSAHRLRRVHGFGRGRSCSAARRIGTLHRHGTRARRLRSRVCASRCESGTCDREHRRRRVFQQRAVLLRVAAHLRARADLSTRSSKDLSSSRASTSSAIRWNSPRPWVRSCVPPPQRRFASRFAASVRAGAVPIIDESEFPASSPGYRLPRAAGIARRRSLDAGDERRDLRTRRGHHEGGLG